MREKNDLICTGRAPKRHDFEMKRQIDLELLECKTFKNGCVYVSYRVKH